MGLFGGNPFKKLGHIIESPFKVAGTVLGIRTPKPQYMEAPELSARELLRQTMATAPEAPQYGDNPKRKKKGRQSLIIDKVDRAYQNGYNSLNI